MAEFEEPFESFFCVAHFLATSNLETPFLEGHWGLNSWLNDADNQDNYVVRIGDKCIFQIPLTVNPNPYLLDSKT